MGALFYGTCCFLGSFHTYPVNLAYESATFLIRSLEWKFLTTLWIRNRVDAKSGYFLSGDVTRWSPVLYREYCIRDGNSVPRFSLLPVKKSTLLFAFFFDFRTDSAIILDANFARFTTHSLLPIFPKEFWVLGWIRIRVRYVWTSKFLNPQRNICGFKNIRILVDGPYLLVFAQIEATAPATQPHLTAEFHLFLIIIYKRIHVANSCGLTIQT